MCRGRLAPPASAVGEAAGSARERQAQATGRARGDGSGVCAYSAMSLLTAVGFGRLQLCLPCFGLLGGGVLGWRARGFLGGADAVAVHVGPAQAGAQDGERKYGRPEAALVFRGWRSSARLGAQVGGKRRVVVEGDEGRYVRARTGLRRI